MSLLVRIAQVKLKEIKGRLDTEVVQAQNKNQTSNLFVRLLKEWQEKSDEKSDGAKDASSERVDFAPLVAKTFPHLVKLKATLPESLRKLAEPKAVPDISVLDEVFGPFPEEPSQPCLGSDSESESPENYANRMLNDEMSSMKDDVAEFCEKELEDKVEPEELEKAARALILERLLSSENERKLQMILKDTEMVKEYASLLTIMMKHIDKWDWNAPMEMKAHFFQLQEKFRGILKENIDDALLLQITARRLLDYVMPKLKKWNKSLHRRFDDTDSDSSRNPLHGYNEWMESVQMNRCFMSVANDNFMESYRNDEGNSYDGAMNAMGQPMALSTAIQYFKAHADAMGGIESLNIVQSDVKNFCHETSHDLIEAILNKFGLPEKWRNFWMRAVKPKFYLEDEESKVMKMERGMLMAHSITQLIGETILICVDRLVLQKTGVRTIRLHDDYLWWHHDKDRATAAWTVFKDTLKRLGYEPKMGGSGHVVIPLKEGRHLRSVIKSLKEKKGIDVKELRKYYKEHSKGPDFKKTKDTLPKGPVRWRVLELTPSGDWKVNQERLAYFNKYWTALASQPESQVSVMTLIKGYNQHGTLLLRLLGLPGAGMGRNHGRLVLETLENLHKTPLPEAPNGMVEYLKKIIMRNLPDCKNAVDCVPDGWFYWPIRAGGLALKNFSITAKQLHDNIDSGVNLLTELNVPRNYLEFLKAMDKRAKKEDKTDLPCDLLPPPWRILNLPEQKPKNGLGGRAAMKVYLNTETYAVKYEKPRWYGNFDYSECTRYSSRVSSWQRQVSRNLSNVWTDVAEAEGPPRTPELRQMISKFLTRKREWVGAGVDNNAKKSDGDLGPYFSEIMHVYGNELLVSFGSFGIIPADLVPHALIKQICKHHHGSRLNGEDESDWEEL